MDVRKKEDMIMPAPKKQALLLLEDYDTLRNSLGRCCSKAGFSVVSTGSIYSAITHAKQERPEVVIFDCSLKMEDDPLVALAILHNLLPKSKLIALHCNEGILGKKLRSLGVTGVIGSENIPTELERLLTPESEVPPVS